MGFYGWIQLRYENLPLNNFGKNGFMNIRSSMGLETSRKSLMAPIPINEND